MATAPGITFAFRLSVISPSGSPVAGASVRLFAGDGTDVTAKLFSSSPVFTTASGSLSQQTFSPGPLPASAYRIQVAAAGYQTATVLTESGFTGFGAYSVILEPVPMGGYVVTPPAALYVSALQPVTASVQVPPETMSADWQTIDTTITRDDTGSSVLAAPVDETGGADIVLTSRLRLKPVLYLVPEGIPATVDYDLFREFVAGLSATTDSGTTQLDDDAFSVIAGNIQPTGTINDLSDYTSYDGLAKWLAPPLPELPVWPGYYADCSVVLHQAGEYVLQYTYLTAGRNMIDAPLLSDPFETPGKKAVKLRIPDPVDTAMYCELVVLKDDEPVTEILTVKYY